MPVNSCIYMHGKKQYTGISWQKVFRVLNAHSKGCHVLRKLQDSCQIYEGRLQK